MAVSGAIGRAAEPERARRAAGQGHAHRQHDQAAARGGAHRAAGRGRPRPAARDPPPLDQGAGGGPRARAGRGAASGSSLPFERGRDPARRRAADRPGPARRLARGAVPRHPDGAVRPADGGPGPARADAPRPCPRPVVSADPEPGPSRAGRSTRRVSTSKRQHPWRAGGTRAREPDPDPLGASVWRRTTGSDPGRAVRTVGDHGSRHPQGRTAGRAGLCDAAGTAGYGTWGPPRRPG